MSYTPSELAYSIGTGLLSFPITPFRVDSLDVDFAVLRDHLGWLSEHPVAGLFAAGGTGEVFSLTSSEIVEVVRLTVDEIGGRVPVLAPAVGSTRMAIALAEAAEKSGADGILLFPPYLTEADDDGLFAHVSAIATSTRLGIVIYSRANARYSPALVTRLVHAHPNVIGYKDGTGDLVTLARIIAEHGDRLVYVGGVPTAEVLAEAYLAIGATTYSSAMFNALPGEALDFYHAVRSGKSAIVRRSIDELVSPWVTIRDRRPGYAVSIIKAALRVRGRNVGPVRPPLVDLTPDEQKELGRIMASSSIRPTRGDDA